MRGLFALAALLFAMTCQAELAVVASKSSPIDKLGEREVADIFLAKTSHVADGQRVRPVELNDSTFKAVFYRKISGKTLAQVHSYWTTLIFTGKGRPPKNLDDVEKLVELLNNDPHAIAYLPLGQVSASMKILYLFH